jgi:hypothetical protein
MVSKNAIRKTSSMAASRPMRLFNLIQTDARQGSYLKVHDQFHLKRPFRYQTQKSCTFTNDLA